MLLSPVPAGLVSSVRADVVRTPAADTVSPGFAGFLTMFVLALAVVLLIRSMVKHLRKVNYLGQNPDQAEPTPSTVASNGTKVIASGRPDALAQQSGAPVKRSGWRRD